MNVYCLNIALLSMSAVLKATHTQQMLASTTLYLVYLLYIDIPYNIIMINFNTKITQITYNFMNKKLPLADIHT